MGAHTGIRKMATTVAEILRSIGDKKKEKKAGVKISREKKGEKRFFNFSRPAGGATTVSEGGAGGRVNRPKL